MSVDSSDRPIWKREAAIAWLIILVFPLGLYLMWRYARWQTLIKWVWTLIVLLVLFFLMFTRPPSEEPQIEGRVGVDSPAIAFL